MPQHPKYRKHPNTEAVSSKYYGASFHPLAPLTQLFCGVPGNNYEHEFLKPMYLYVYRVTILKYLDVPEKCWHMFLYAGVS